MFSNSLMIVANSFRKQWGKVCKKKRLAKIDETDWKSLKWNRKCLEACQQSLMKFLRFSYRYNQDLFWWNTIFWSEISIDTMTNTTQQRHVETWERDNTRPNNVWNDSLNYDLWLHCKNWGERLLPIEL